MKRLIPLALLALVAFAPARDKKDVERIAQLEHQVAELKQGQDAIDAGARDAFERVQTIILHLIEAAQDADERISRLEHMNKAE